MNQYQDWSIQHWDLLAASAYCGAAAFVLYVIPDSALGPPVILPFMFFLPGYVLLSTLFPTRLHLGLVQRLSASVGLSVVVSGILMMMLAYGVGTERDALFATLAVWIGTMSLLAVYRRRLAPTSVRFTARIAIDKLRFWKRRQLDRPLTIVYVLAFASLVAACVLLVLISERARPHFSEFFVAGGGGDFEEYTWHATVGESIEVRLGVVNHEGRDIDYHIQMIGVEGLEPVASRLLSPEEKWEHTTTFSITTPGLDRKVTFLLFRAGELEPIRSLHFWLAVDNSPTAKSGAVLDSGQLIPR